VLVHLSQLLLSPQPFTRANGKSIGEEIVEIEVAQLQRAELPTYDGPIDDTCLMFTYCSHGLSTQMQRRTMYCRSFEYRLVAYIAHGRKLVSEWWWLPCYGPFCPLAASNIEETVRNIVIAVEVREVRDDN
jgi:hypothetical protein